jgi:hypothetical protein
MGKDRSETPNYETISNYLCRYLGSSEVPSKMLKGIYPYQTQTFENKTQNENLDSDKNKKKAHIYQKQIL